MSLVFEASQYFTRHQADHRYLRLPAAPSSPTGLSLSGTGLVTTPQDQYAYFYFTLTVPLESVSTLEFSVVRASTAEAHQVSFPVVGDGLYRIENLEPGSAYVVTVRAIDSYGQASPFTASATFNTAADTLAPAIPVLLVSPASNAGAILRISPPNTEPDFNRYELYRGQSANGWDAIRVASFTESAFYDQAIPSEGNYYYRVRAYDISGNYSTSEIVGPTLLQATVIEVPTSPDMTQGSIVTNADGSITLDWPAVADAGLSWFRIWRRRPLSAWLLLHTITAVPGMPGTFTDTSPIGGTTYDYSVSAVNATGSESAFDQDHYLTASSEDTLTPSPPSNLSFQGGAGSVAINWGPSASADVLYYEVSYRLTPSSAWEPAILVGRTSYTIFGRSESRDVLYNQLQVKVRARDRNGNYSPEVQGTVRFQDLASYQPADNLIPPSPLSVSAATNNDGTITLSWLAPAGIPDLWGYQIEVLDSRNEGVWELVALLHDSTSGTKTYTDVGLEPYSYAHTTYRYRVLTLDNSGNSSSFNLVENSSFEYALLGWDLTTEPGFIHASVTSPVRSGSKALQANYAGRVSQTIPVTAGLPYLFSAYVRNDQSSGLYPQIRLSWRDESDNVISEQTASVASSSSYQRVVVDMVVAPILATNAVLILEACATQSSATFFWEDVQFEQSPVITSYADGKTAVLKAVDLQGPQPYTTMGCTATGALGAIALRWLNPDPAHNPNQYWDYINSVFEVYRSETVNGTYVKVNEVAGAMDGAQNAYDDLDPSEVEASTYFYKIKARDRFGNLGPFLGDAVSAVSLTVDDLNIVAVDVTCVDGTPAAQVKTLSLAAGQTSQELLTNPTFERDLLGWTKGAGVDAAVDEDVYRIGTRCLKISNASLTDTWYQQSSIPVKDGHTYQVSGWLKVEDLEAGTGEGCGISVTSPTSTLTVLKMVGTDIYPTDHVVGLHATETPLTTDWGRVALVFSVTTDGTIDLILALGVNGTCQGTLWTDGVSCVDITESDRLFKALDDNAALRGVTNLPSSQVQFQIVDENGNLFNPLGATTVGAAAQIISKPFWLKAGGTTVPYLSADCDIPSLSQNTPYWVYFDDPGFVGGDVSLYATMNLGEAQANIGRICLGVIKTPKSLTGARTERPTVYDDFGTASVYNPTGAFDATENVADTYCEVKGFTVPLPPLFEEYEQTEAHCIFRGFTNPTGSKSSVELSITSLVDTANGYGVLSYSLDGGVTWEDVYTAYDSLALVTDSISLSDDQDWSQVQVYAVGCTTMAMLGAYGSVSVYDIKITGTIG